nr:MAG TPA: hypothetical protein [Caudoviricetes sp.]
MVKINTIGIRVKASEITYSIIKDNEFVVDVLYVPRALDEVQKLSFIRNNFFSIFLEYNIDKAGIKLIEPLAFDGTNANKINSLMFRMNIEGVLLELFGNSDINSYATFISNQLSAKLNFKYKEFQNLINGENLLEIDNWENFKKEEREAIIIAKILKDGGHIVEDK